MCSRHFKSHCAAADRAAIAHSRVLTISREMWSTTFLDEGTEARFDRLMDKAHRQYPRYDVFDALSPEGQNLRQLPLFQRKRLVNDCAAGSKRAKHRIVADVRNAATPKASEKSSNALGR